MANVIKKRILLDATGTFRIATRDVKVRDVNVLRIPADYQVGGALEGQLAIQFGEDEPLELYSMPLNMSVNPGCNDGVALVVGAALAGEFAVIAIGLDLEPDPIPVYLVAGPTQ